MNWGGFALAAAIAAFLAVRWRAHGWMLRIGAFAAIAAATTYGFGLYELPNIEHLILDIGQTLGKWTYLVVGVMAFLETGAFVGLIAPGETTVLVGGLVAGQGEIDIVVLIAIVWMCAVGGDVTSYFLGRRLGRAFLVKHGPRVKITEERIKVVEAFFERRGGITILIGRFIGLVRALAPFLAGASRMPLSKFLPYDIVGAGAWAATFSLLGYIFWRSFDKVANYVGTGLFAFGASVTAIVGVFLIARIVRHPERRREAHEWVSKQADRPLLRPLARVLRPAYYRFARPLLVRLGGPARFAWNRLTPGQLGLEFTTALALLAVGAYATAVLFRQVGPGPPPFVDREAYDLSGELQTNFLIELCKAVSNLGRIEVVATIVVLTALWAAWRRRWEEAVGLVAGLLLTAVLVDLLQDSRDRLRPPGSLVATTTPSYPSGHAAFVVAFVPSMVTLIRMDAGLAGRLGGVTVALILGGAVAISRVYLRAQWLIDVIGGIALGVACFAFTGIVALIVSHRRKRVAVVTVRKNEGQ